MKPVKFEEQTLDVHADGAAARDAIRKLGELIHGIQTAMLITVDARGHFRARPMATHQSELHDELWFYVDARSSVIDDITERHQVNVSYVDNGKRYVSVSGIAHVVRNPDLLRRFWNKKAAEWFPDGPDNDPHLALLRIQLEEAEYWDVGSKAMVRLLGMAVTAERAAPVVRPAAPPYELPTREA